MFQNQARLPENQMSHFLKTICHIAWQFVHQCFLQTQDDFDCDFSQFINFFFLLFVYIEGSKHGNKACCNQGGERDCSE